MTTQNIIAKAQAFATAALAHRPGDLTKRLVAAMFAGERMDSSDEVRGLSIMLKGLHGTGKTSIVNLFAGLMGLSMSDGWLVNGTQGTTEASVTAEWDLGKLTSGQRVALAARVMNAYDTKDGHGFALINELGRMNQFTQDAFFGPFSEGDITIGSSYVKRITPGVLFATSNEAEFDMAFMDRFSLCFFPQAARGEEGKAAILKRTNPTTAARKVEQVMTTDDLKAIRQHVTANIEVTAEAAATAYYFVRSTQICPELTIGQKGALPKDKGVLAAGCFPSKCAECGYLKNAKGRAACHMSQALSMRAALSAVAYAQAVAFMDGRDKVTDDDIKKAMPFVVAHRAQYTEQHKTGDMEQQATAFVNAMHTAAGDAIGISVNATRYTAADIAKIEAEGSPLVLEAMEGSREAIMEGSKKLRASLGRMDSAQLQQARKSVGADDQKLVDDMLSARAVVGFDLDDRDSISDFFFTSSLVNRDGQPYFSPDELGGLENDGHTKSAMFGVEAVLSGNRLVMKFSEPQGNGSIEADAFRARAISTLADYGKISDPYDAKLQEKLESAGVMEEISKPAKKAPAAKAASEQPSLI